ncbi:MAG: hypothetical protein A3B96_00680 [Candidatus Spechtbacteria bacterium RIFCSPHIGHO2_02_FULL_43_15b]|uniref:Uncharacterized protein n=1 Tax=Candidatus Spechtbacteria bacterium RIFCSPHIGHO2_01_FULL_43_30 TaxID=1802158 RepID=A0A1G2H6T0_9BACT|nr:MAG: hypothetical protein A2827_01660 [Candidatus Spechtbacteria bacterium RIFCSPHIGHO2_01_FULL_43_30]OGZ59969.1 MAG: hypothetical protein A3B96_00680 [Candidatus Spechtbacteria bacterium RIFCSPHIGHO2_02_FULL_43_15b]
MADAQATEVLSILEQAKERAKKIIEMSRDLVAERELLRRVVSEYSAKRVELVKQELEARGLTWCTSCSNVTSGLDIEFLLVEGSEVYSHGYGNSYYGFRPFSKLYQACIACRKCAADKHGQMGAYDYHAEGQSSFLAFRVEKREDGYYACKFGNWVKLEEKQCELNGLSSELVEKLVEEWGLPPRMEVKTSAWSSEENLIIH